MAEQETALASFMGVTGASEAEARFLLEASGWNLNSAVAQFLDGGGATSGPSLDGGGAMSGASVPAEDVQQPMDEDYVRAPDRAKQQRLLDRGNEPPQTAAMPGAFADFRDEGEESREQQTNSLAKLFAAPTKLMHSGDFQSARRLGKEERKWLLVVLADESSFANAEMNRDVWADETVAAVVESQFVLWMRPHLDREAVVFVDRYDRDRAVVATSQSNHFARVHPKHPHVAVVDPRTGRRLWYKEGKMTADSLIESLTDVADRHSMEDQPRDLPPVPPPVMPPPVMPPPVMPPAPPTPVEPPPWEAFAAPAAVAANDEAVLVQFKLLHKDAGPMTRKCRFHPHETVGALFKFAQTETNAGPAPFDLRFGFPPQPLWPLRDQTVSEAKLHGESISMKFLL